jgi:hypothetical protein
MSSDLFAPRKVTLKQDLIGRVPYCPSNVKTTPQGAEVQIVNQNHTYVDSLINWDGRALLVNKELLIS